MVQQLGAIDVLADELNSAFSICMEVHNHV